MEVIKLEITPVQVNLSIPVGATQKDNPPGEGFSDLRIEIASGPLEALEKVVYLTSYDGEGEILATVIEKPERVTLEEATTLLEAFFATSKAQEA